MTSARLVYAVGSIVLLSGCATIVHEKQQPITVTSTPAGARVTIVDRNDQLVMTGTTPFVALLDRGAGYFKAARYRMKFQMPGYEDAALNATARVNGAYFANLLFGVLSPVALFGIDPVSGAMYTLTPKKIDQPLASVQSTQESDLVGQPNP